ncbi:hypothetical protein MAPG_02970 [Magnaporthiopsis poae ATCC 64411]|uniref:Ig-like domain-containing protein n=1 Tax=Magnaporthiopsis poae (strain ATCC 64411 / 73-15) TaxID=644358 RepID=A0A0C4DSS9_MAGP6|nr:hypothetical protein MAPG_02970 [Magnaporthiopsis poae ATCC 64411]
MQLTKLFTAVLVALAGQALGAADIVETSSVSSQASAAATGPADPPRPNLMCKPTGRGYCTIEIYSGTWPSGDGLLPGSGQWSIQSRLPHTVELTIRGDDLDAEGEIWYAGRKTDLNAGWRYNCNDFNADTECLRLAFNCS